MDTEQSNVGNNYLCLTQNCPNTTQLVLDMNDIEKHPQHNLVKIKTLIDSLNDPQHALNKFQQINREQVISGVDKKIQELKELSQALINEFGEKMKQLANDTMNLYDNQIFLINAVNSLEVQVIQDNSKAISQLFSMDQMEIEQKVKEATDMQLKLNEQTEGLKEQMKKMFQSIDLTNNQQEAIQGFKWSQYMKNNNIEIKEFTALYGKYDTNYHMILLEPKIEFNSIQSCRVKFHGGHNKWNGGIFLVDSKIQRENNPKFIDNYVGSYSFFNDGSVQYDGKKLSIKAFKFNQNETIEVIWDGPRKIYGIQKIGTQDRFEIKVEFLEDSELCFGVELRYNDNCSIE